MQIWIDGEYVSFGEDTAPLLSHGFDRGVTVFEVVKVVDAVGGPALFALDEHLDRFFTSAELVKMDLGVGPEELTGIIRQVAAKNRIKAGAAKMYGYYPGLAWGLEPVDLNPSLVVYCANYEDFGIGSTYPGGPVRLAISPYRKLPREFSLPPGKFCGNYVEAYLALLESRERGFDKALMIDTEGLVCEGGAFSIFFVRNGALLTPPLDRVLPGTTRTAVLDVGRWMGLEVIERDIPADEIETMDEAFCTGSVSTLTPVTEIEDITLGACCPGPLTARLTDKMNLVYQGRIPEFTRFLTYC